MHAELKFITAGHSHGDNGPSISANLLSLSSTNLVVYPLSWIQNQGKERHDVGMWNSRHLIILLWHTHSLL